jgi:cyclic pyranopterin phosphate synthase
MKIQTRLFRFLRPTIRKVPALKSALVNLDVAVTRQRHELAKALPFLIKPEPRLLQVAITALCNLRCLGCRYGRDFMPGRSLPLSIVLNLLEDAQETGFRTVRLYGGEPLLHKDLPEMIRAACRLGVYPVITTNAILLGEKIDTLFDAGLRSATVGFYGNERSYDPYVQRNGAYARLERSLETVRARYGREMRLQVNFLLSRRSCNLEEVRHVLRFAERYETSLQVDLVHYSLPYFSEGVNRELQFRPCDLAALQVVTNELLDYRHRRPDLYPEHEAAIRSIPDWAVKGPEMRVPCTAYRMIWVGADGTVQLCYVTFKLGNLYEKRLRDMMFGFEHNLAARNAFALKCPNCHCQRDERVVTDKSALRLYSATAPSIAAPVPSPVSG